VHIIGAITMGLATGMGLIVAIGAQNAFVLRLGITGPRRAIVAVVLVCALSDLALIAAGVLGVGVLVRAAPMVLVLLRFAGASFLLVYGVRAALRAVHPAALAIEDAPAVASDASAGAAAVAVQARPDVLSRPAIRTAVLTAFAFTWLNPHVWLDTVLFLGSIANQQGSALRWWWAAGAMVASCLWFSALGFGARFLRPVFERPGAWRVLDSLIAVVMIGLGARLLFLG
jgi:L-lysine exporter family protein LysE/ArgO